MPSAFDSPAGDGAAVPTLKIQMILNSRANSPGQCPALPPTGRPLTAEPPITRSYLEYWGLVLNWNVICNLSMGLYASLSDSPAFDCSPLPLQIPNLTAQCLALSGPSVYGTRRLSKRL